MNQELTIQALDSLADACDNLADLCEMLVDSQDARILGARHHINAAFDTIEELKAEAASTDTVCD